MKEKKTEVLTVRITSTTKQALSRAAESREWSLSKMAEKILSSWAEQQLDNDGNATTPTNK